MATDKGIFSGWQLGDSEFKFISNVVYNESGIKLTEIKKALVQARLTGRLRELGFDNFKDYISFLNSDYDSEKIHLINRITTNKTDFFREDKHFKFMTDVILPQYESYNKKSIRVWSAGCSSGEEPYSIAITLFDFYEHKNPPDIKILATDIDTEVLRIGAEGIYDDERVEDIDIDILKKYFYRRKNENVTLYKIKDVVRKKIYFRRLNLLNETYPMKKTFDMIFCRNVLIYFDKITQKKLLEHYSRYLTETSYLFTGFSETLAGFTDKYHLIRNSIYQKV